jgi:acetyltransferase-like isoleucine patch superfamily enzyme
MSTRAHVFVHPHGVCESATVGDGTRIWAFAHVMDGASIGAGCTVGDHVFIETGAVLGDGVTVKNGVQVWDGVSIGDAVFLGPGVAFTNDRIPRAFAPEFERVPTRVDRGASICANATIVCGIEIGAYSMVGAGAVVTADVAPYALVAGNPARRIGWVCECGRRLDTKLGCSCGKSYRTGDEETAGLSPR